jgi:hypothetical protein
MVAVATKAQEIIFIKFISKSPFPKNPSIWRGGPLRAGFHLWWGKVSHPNKILNKML